MKAIANLQVTDEHIVEVKLKMTVREMRALDGVLSENTVWPIWNLRVVLHDTLNALEEHFTAEHGSEP